MIMSDELLSDILAAEREIRLQIESLEQVTADHLEKRRQELDHMLEDESKALQAELEKAVAGAEHSAVREAEASLASAREYARRLEDLDIADLDRVVLSYLTRILPEGADDRQDEQT